MITIKNIAQKVPAQLSTLIDQCIVSGSSFILNVLLVSFLGMELFGVFSFIWMSVLFVSGLQQSLIIMPMYALSSKATERSKYLGEVYQIQLYFSVASFIGCLVLFWGLQSWSSLTFFEGFMTSIVVGLYIFQDFLRRLLFVVEAPLKVVIIDVLGFGLLPIILSVLYFFETLSLDSLLVTIASTKIVSILLGIYYTRPFILTSRTIKPTIIIHWKYAKFLFASSILQWFSGNIFVLFSGIFIGPVALGALRVAQNILGILNIFFLFLENSIPIKAAHVLHTSGREKFNRYMLKVFKQHFIVLFIFLIGIYVFQDQLLHLFYGSAMDHFEWLIPAFCGLYILIFFGTILRFVYRTIEKNEVLFYGYITSSILGLAISYPLIQFTGLYGVVVGLFVTQLASLLTYYFHYKFNQ